MGKKLSYDKAIERMVETDRTVARLEREGTTDNWYYRLCVRLRNHWTDKSKEIRKGKVGNG